MFHHFSLGHKNFDRLHERVCLGAQVSTQFGFIEAEAKSYDTKFYHKK